MDKDIDLSSESTTLAVRRGTGSWPGYRSGLIAPERLLAVASPAFWARHPGIAAPRDLLRLPLVHHDEPHRFRPGWREFFAHHGVEFRDGGEGLRLNDYALVVQAAMAGEGLALGWWHICKRPIRQGLLVALDGLDVLTGEGFHLVWSENGLLSRDAALTRDWMLASRLAPE